MCRMDESGLLKDPVLPYICMYKNFFKKMLDKHDLSLYTNAILKTNDEDE